MRDACCVVTGWQAKLARWLQRERRGCCVRAAAPAILKGTTVRVEEFRGRFLVPQGSFPAESVLDGQGEDKAPLHARDREAA